MLWHFGTTPSAAMLRWYFGPEHIAKLRLWRYVLNAMNNPRLSVRYGRKSVITLDYRDWLQHQILRSGVYEPEVWDTLGANATSGEVFWDIGAHIGTFTILARADERIATVHSFEPEPRTHHVLDGHVRLNPGNTCHIHRMALGSSIELRTLTSGPDANTGMASLVNESTPDRKRSVVACSTVDTLVYEVGLASPTLMKIDVEGWELEVLRGAGRVLHEMPPKAIVFEAACDDSARIFDADIGDFLESNGYNVSHIARPNGEMQPRENYLATLRDIRRLEA